MPAKKAPAAKGKGKGKKQADENQGPTPADLVKKFVFVLLFAFYSLRFKKTYNEACKAANVAPQKPIVRKMDEKAEEEQLLDRFTLCSHFLLNIMFTV